MPARLQPPTKCSARPRAAVALPIGNESAHWGTLAYEKALYLDALSDAAIAVIADHALKKKSPLSFVPTFRLDGKYLARSDADSAFGGNRSGGSARPAAAMDERLRLPLAAELRPFPGRPIKTRRQGVGTASLRPLRFTATMSSGVLAAPVSEAGWYSILSCSLVTTTRR
jgi:hypothetical protein